MLLHIFSSLPCPTAWVLDGAVTLGTFGAAERTCRRWRRLALGLAGQHPLDIWCANDALQGDMWSPAVAGELTHCLSARRPACVAVHWPNNKVTQLLLGLRLPAVRGLTEHVGTPRPDGVALLRSLPHTFPALEELRTFENDDMPFYYALAHAEAYPAALRLLPGLTAVDIRVPDIDSDLVGALLALPQLQNVRLTLHGPLPGPDMWQQLGQLGPRLRHISLRLEDPGEEVPPELFGLPSTAELRLFAAVEGEEFDGLQRLPSLRRLDLAGGQPTPAPVPAAAGPAPA